MAHKRFILQLKYPGSPALYVVDNVTLTLSFELAGVFWSKKEFEAIRNSWTENSRLTVEWTTFETDRVPPSSDQYDKKSEILRHMSEFNKIFDEPIQAESTKKIK